MHLRAYRPRTHGKARLRTHRVVTSGSWPEVRRLRKRARFLMPEIMYSEGPAGTFHRATVSRSIPLALSGSTATRESPKHRQVPREARVIMTASPTDDLDAAERRNQELTKELSRARGELSQARGELAEAREQQVATADILRVISSSPTDLQPVFAEIAASAARLCDAHDAVIRQVDGEVLRLVAHHGAIGTQGHITIPLSRSSLLGCAVIDRRTIQVADQQSQAEYPESRNRALQFGHRTALGVPLVHAGEAVGVILIRRIEVRPFTDRQIELLKTFADQAVIAIENTRLFEAEQARTREVEVKSTELAQSLEYQTAISEVLGVISRSPNELQPVVDSISETAVRLCGADWAFIR